MKQVWNGNPNAAHSGLIPFHPLPLAFGPVPPFGQVQMRVVCPVSGGVGLHKHRRTVFPHRSDQQVITLHVHTHIHLTLWGGNNYRMKFSICDYVHKHTIINNERGFNQAVEGVTFACKNLHKLTYFDIKFLWEIKLLLFTSRLSLRLHVKPSVYMLFYNLPLLKSRGTPDKMSICIIQNSCTVILALFTFKMIPENQNFKRHFKFHNSYRKCPTNP